MTDTLVQAHRATWKYLSPTAAYRRAVAVIDRSGLLPIVEHNLNAITGRPRTFTARALLVGMTLHAVTGSRTMVMTDIVNTLRNLGPSQRSDLGLDVEVDVTYPMLWHAFAKIATQLDDGGLHIPGSEERLTVQQFADRLLAASVPATYNLTGSAAIDGTDLEAWARRRSWANKKDLPTAGTEIPDGTDLGPSKPVNEPGWPLWGGDGRPQNSSDSEARDGYRSGHNGRPGDVYIGYELHLATQIPTIGGTVVPHLVTGMTLTPAGSHRGDAAVRTIDGMTAAGTPITDLCVDRGYNFCLPETFAYPMWARNIDVWGDLHPKQRGQRPGPIPGTIWIDGTLFTEALPKLLRNLTPPGAYATTAEAEAAQADFDRRRAYAFTPLTKRDPDGYQRLKGPALAGQVRCSNSPRSLRLSHATRPTTNCGPSCACGKTVTITPDQSPRERMPQPWGTTDWAAAYYRRSAIESTNAELKNHRLDIGKGFTRVFGVVRNTLLCAFAFAGMNVRMIRDWHARRSLPDPWAVALGELDLGDGAAALRAKLTRARRRTGTLQELLGDPPPDIRDGTESPS